MEENSKYWKVKRDESHPMWEKFINKTKSPQEWDYKEFIFDWQYYGITPKYTCLDGWNLDELYGRKCILITIDEACERLGIK